MCIYGNDVDAESICEEIRYLHSIANGDCAAPPERPGPSGCSTTNCRAGAGSLPVQRLKPDAVEVRMHCQWTTYAGGNTWTTDTHGQEPRNYALSMLHSLDQ
ncbi:hypothetical protein DL764_001148 [Monosporascus ibericus]|uniref:Uncharacterized protein n=1 Tax=Monosporascus ibericus TaxID=155417 RepID=A0A4Q4TSH4_9PEZI|nr:hypothetical protein DL764_001148 [Monosporascus ibericus]